MFRVSQFSLWIVKMVGKEKSKLCWDKQFSAQNKKVLNPTPGASNVSTQDASDSNASSSRITTQDTSQNPVDGDDGPQAYTTPTDSGPQPYTMPHEDEDGPQAYTMPPDSIKSPAIYTMPPSQPASIPTMPSDNTEQASKYNMLLHKAESLAIPPKVN